MNEKLLQYLWNFKIFTSFNFHDTEGNEVEILDFGKWNYDSGPDFLFGKIKTKGVILAGHIELHVKSSDWIFHRHTGNPEFENVILHAVFHDDAEIQTLAEKNVPTLELKNYIDPKVLHKYEILLNENQFIPCEEIFDINKVPFHFSEENLLRKLDLKSLEIEESLKRFKNNYEAVLFHYLAYSFGLKVNAEIFKQMAESVDFSIINKIRQNQTYLEAVFFGKSGWLSAPKDEETKLWSREYHFLKAKYQIADNQFTPKFSKLRPPNFPTIRLSQLASLYHLNQNLFSKIISAKKVSEIDELFKNVKAGQYWNNRFNFYKISTVEGEKRLTKDFVDIVLINAVLPLKYAYHKHTEENINDEILDFYRNISPEKNNIIQRWESLKMPAKTALESQALLFHYKHFCQRKNCLNCSVGLQLLKTV